MIGHQARSWSLLHLYEVAVKTARIRRVDVVVREGKLPHLSFLAILLPKVGVPKHKKIRSEAIGISVVLKEHEVQRNNSKQLSYRE